MLGRTRSTSDRGGSRDGAWRAAIRRRWKRLQRLIVLQEERLEATWPWSDRARIEKSLRWLKRVALGVWVAAREEGVELSFDQPPAHPGESRRNDAPT
jgi:hypothetical protein